MKLLCLLLLLQLGGSFRYPATSPPSILFRRSSLALGSSSPAASFSFEVTLDNGAAETVTLSCEADADAEAARIVGRHPDAAATAANLSAVLREQWQRVMPGTFCGPGMPGGEPLEGLLATFKGIPVARSGLVLDVARSLAAPAAGRGLFVRKASGDAEDVTLYGGQPLCGYGEGRMSAAPVEAGGKTIVFRLDSLRSDVFFQDQLMPLGAALARAAATTTAAVEGGGEEGPEHGSGGGGGKRVGGAREVRLAAHVLTRDAATGEVTGVAPDPHYDGPYRYFVPVDEEEEDDGEGDDDEEESGRGGGGGSGVVSAMSVGKMCNDLAVTLDAETGKMRVAGERRNGGDDEAAYGEAADKRNLLVLTYRLHLLGDGDGDGDGDGGDAEVVTIVPSAPLLTLTRSATFRNDEPLELGCRYGFQYWQDELAAVAGGKA